jgi:hypothetical protein
LVELLKHSTAVENARERREKSILEESTPTTRTWQKSTHRARQHHVSSISVIVKGLSSVIQWLLALETYTGSLVKVGKEVGEARPSHTILSTDPFSHTTSAVAITIMRGVRGVRGVRGREGGCKGGGWGQAPCPLNCCSRMRV